MRDVTIYSSDACPYCTAAKRVLSARGIEYDEITLALDAEGRRALVERTGRWTFPQIFVDGELVGGYHDLLAFVLAGRLSPQERAA